MRVVQLWWSFQLKETVLKRQFIQQSKLAENVQAIQDVDKFVSSSKQIWRYVALHHLLINGSSAVNGCRQNESPNSW